MTFLGFRMAYTAAEMRSTFWRLGDNWWKQIYDGKYHSFGADVFDLGLHGSGRTRGIAEPGYYASVKKAAEFASMELGKQLTKEMYLRIHSLACEHFSDVDQKVINVEKDKIHQFRAVHCGCSQNLVTDSNEAEDKYQAKMKKYSFIFIHSLRMNLQNKYHITTESGSKQELEKIPVEIKSGICSELTRNGFFAAKGVNSVDILNNGYVFYENAFTALNQINIELANLQQKLHHSKPLATLTLNSSLDTPFITINYNFMNPVEIEEIVSQLIINYNDIINSLPEDTTLRNEEQNQQALRAIAELFQHLEWLHPFYDGQGRTDLVLLAKLLTENGFNPSILYQPYFSTFEPLDKWTHYLKKGIEAWKIEALKIESSIAIDPLKSISML